MTRRSLSQAQRIRVFDGGEGRCHICETKISVGDLWDVSHVIPLAAGGKDEPSNMSPAHRRCHQQVTAESDLPLIAKVRRQRAKHLGIRKPASMRHPTLRRKMSGEVVPR